MKLNISGQSTSSGSGYSTIDDEAIPLTAETVLNFTGNAVTVTDDPVNSRTNVAISATTQANALTISSLRG